MAVFIDDITLNDKFFGGSVLNGHATSNNTQHRLLLCVEDGSGSFRTVKEYGNQI